MRLPGPLLVVTDRHQATRPLPDLVGAIAAAGARWIWLRDRDLPEAERGVLARALRDVLAPLGGTLTVGADAVLAEAVGAHGVHLRGAEAVAEARGRLGPGALLGVSAHSLADVRAARDAGADYATLSPVFATASKPGYGPALGLSGLTAAAACGLPLLALGGIEAGNAADCLRAGAASIAVMGGVMRAADPASEVRTLLTALTEGPIPTERGGWRG